MEPVTTNRSNPVTGFSYFKGQMTKEELEKKHEDYLSFIDEWLFYSRSYLGGKFYRDGNYLKKHPFESPENYERRKEIAYYYNYCAPIVDIFTSYLSKKQPRRSYGALSGGAVPPRQPKTLFDAFWWDCDLEETNFEQFMRGAERFASIYGRVSIIVDKPAAVAATKADAIAKGIRPYVALMTPENILDWSYVRLDTGRPVLGMVKIREAKDTYRIWTRQGWELWALVENIPKLQKAGEHNLGVVPLVNLYNKKSPTRMIGVSDLMDLADINKNIYYLCSDAKEIIENTAFPMLALPFEGGTSGGSGGEDKEVGPANILQFDPEKPNSKPFWLEAPHTSLKEIREWIQQDAQEMARIAKMGGLRNIQSSRQPWSGVSIEAQERELFAALAEKATNAEQAELDIFRLWARWEGEEFTGNVEYPRDFAIRDFTMALQNAVTAGTANVLSLTFEKERQKKIVDATLPELDEAKMEQITKEIDALKELPKNTNNANGPVSNTDIKPPPAPARLEG